MDESAATLGTVPFIKLHDGFSSRMKPVHLLKIITAMRPGTREKRVLEVLETMHDKWNRGPQNRQPMTSSKVIAGTQR
jgi:hypothetical protein